MDAYRVIENLSYHYGFNVDEAIILLGLTNINRKTYNEDSPESNNFTNTQQIKPFDGIVKQNCCKAVIYNHGLYTQCTVETDREFCSSVCKRLKYGHINVRKNYAVGSYVLENGKKEIPYQKVKKRLDKNNKQDSNVSRILTEDSDNEMDLNQDISLVKNPRGRPKMPAKEIDVKIDSCDYIENRDSNIEEVLVHRENINGKDYLISENNVVFDSKSYKMIGRFVLGKIIYV